MKRETSISSVGTVSIQELPEHVKSYVMVTLLCYGTADPALVFTMPTAVSFIWHSGCLHTLG